MNQVSLCLTKWLLTTIHFNLLLCLFISVCLNRELFYFPGKPTPDFPNKTKTTITAKVVVSLQMYLLSCL